jgi:uncharacterized BrkB/YihY/UPF0761 family membrane protein
MGRREVMGRFLLGLLWTLICFGGFVVLFIFTQFGDPATETAHRFQQISGGVIGIGTPLIWIVGLTVIFRLRSR